MAIICESVYLTNPFAMSVFSFKFNMISPASSCISVHSKIALLRISTPFFCSSIALRDAIQGINISFIEVHISNIFNRESFRHHSYFSDIAVGSIIGLGLEGYELAALAAVKKFK